MFILGSKHKIVQEFFLTLIIISKDTCTFVKIIPPIVLSVFQFCRLSKTTPHFFLSISLWTFFKFFSDTCTPSKITLRIPLPAPLSGDQHMGTNSLICGFCPGFIIHLIKLRKELFTPSSEHFLKCSLCPCVLTYTTYPSLSERYVLEFPFILKIQISRLFFFVENFSGYCCFISGAYDL